jgi:NADPH-dependent 2,4-dienoyl-CoA reductase/sulfur reductase-like enzyme/rhodanese-related sulfurtransferase
MDELKRRILIVGGVAGGASAAARARRLCERCEIVVFDRGPYVSFANCGLPYYVGDVIVEEEKLLVATPELFENRFNIHVHTESEVTAINRSRQEIEVLDLKTGESRSEHYDYLILSTGAKPIRPPLPGIDLPGIFMLRTIPDSRKIRNAVQDATRAVVVGGGFVGLEMAENLRHRGLDVTLVEMADQVMPPLDPEMAVMVADRLQENGVHLQLGAGVEGFARNEDGSLRVQVSTGDELDTDLVILAIGVRPETRLFESAGLALGERGGVAVDEYMQTDDPRIWAVGDVIETEDVVTGSRQLIPLAGPANRQGRVAAGSVIRDSLGKQKRIRFRGVQATAVCGVFGLTAATTGASEKALERQGIDDYQAVYLHPGNHVGYYPGATPIHIKLLFSRSDGKVLGAQAIGESGITRRIDVISMAIQMGGTVFDLEEAELCYAPQFGAAKDPVNLAGMIAANHLRGDLPLADWRKLGSAHAELLDVRSTTEFKCGHIPGASNIPLENLRERLVELSDDKEIWLVCGVGQRAYYATRTLLQNNIEVKNLSGGMQTYDTFLRAGLLP